MSDDELALHGSCTVRPGGTIDLPQDAVENAGLDLGQRVQVASVDGKVVLLSWTEDDAREMLLGGE